ncbi:(Fe-S)-binding protein [Spirochaetia bacterium]|nr:(Fe-S)-binding protein [Spirochaetia bacterium]
MKDEIIAAIKRFVLDDKENWFPLTNERFYDEPLVRFVSASQYLFSEYKTLIGAEHVTPKEAFETEFGSGTFTSGTVLSVVLPINEKIRESNRGQKDWPSKEWVLNRTFGDGVLINKTAHYIEELLRTKGFRAIAPYSAPWFHTLKTPTGPSSIWSERHIAYAAGQGTFSLNEGLITERGIAVRLISVVTDWVLERDDGEAETVIDHHANCLFYGKDTKCGACIARCPVHAITEQGHDKVACWQYCYGEESAKVAVSFGGNPKNGAGCGLCQTGVPCEYKNPLELRTKL